MTRVKKEPPEHKDVIGQPVYVGSKLAVARNNSLMVCSVIELCPKMIKVKPVMGTYRQGGFVVYSSQTVVIEGPDVLAYVLRGKA